MKGKSSAVLSLSVDHSKRRSLLYIYHEEGEGTISRKKGEKVDDSIKDLPV